jgi:ABC-type Mn2+/Zn2+ transport system permease subunit
MMVEAVMIGAFCTVCGLFLSYGLSDTFEINVPTGPLIILIAVAVYGASSAAHSVIARNP